MFQKVLQKLLKKEDLTFPESEALFSDMLHGLLTSSQIAALLTALAMKGESVEEIAGAAAVMRSRAVQIEPKVKNLTDFLFSEKIVTHFGKGFIQVKLIRF